MSVIVSGTKGVQKPNKDVKQAPEAEKTATRKAKK